jgi:hypothetical protein
MPDAVALNALILLDRSGSMESRWDEALGAVNAYVKALGEADVSLATFDGVDGLKFEVIRDHVDATAWKDVTSAEASPRGQTPLYDAFARIVAMADAAGREKTIIIVMTDGAENASREVSRKDVLAMVERCKSRGWQVVFLGADFDALAEADQIGVPSARTLNMRKGRYRAAFERLARHTREFADTDAPADIEFTQEDRDAAAEE